MAAATVPVRPAGSAGATPGAGGVDPPASRPRSHRDWYERDLSYAAVSREIRPAGGTGVSLIRVRRQPPGFYARDGAPEFTLSLRERASGRTKLTFGGDAFEVSPRVGECMVAPANRCRFRE